MLVKRPPEEKQLSEMGIAAALTAKMKTYKAFIMITLLNC